MKSNVELSQLTVDPCDPCGCVSVSNRPILTLIQFVAIGISCVEADPIQQLWCNLPSIWLQESSRILKNPDRASCRIIRAKRINSATGAILLAVDRQVIKDRLRRWIQ